MNPVDLLADSSIQIDHYQITEKIGSGSASIVYHGIQESTGQEVAIKVMKTTPADSYVSRDKKSARFKREMKLCTQIRHRNIVQVLDFGELGNSIFYTVFEYLPGETLASLLEREGALSLDRCKNLLSQILEGINASHKSGIIHRDLKPENIMVVKTFSDEQIKILDFGVSTFVPTKSIHNTKVTATQEFLGTPAYSAPEQLKGEPVTFKADLFSWGLITIECITGLPPYQEQNVARLVQKMLSASPVPIPGHIINHPLGSLLGWVLQKDIQRRAGDASQVLKRFSSISFMDIPQLSGFLKQDVKFLSRVEEPHTSILPTSLSQERKQLTFMSLALELKFLEKEIESDFLDEIYYNILETCLAISTAAGGYCNNEISDRMIIYFGYPSTTGNESKRAAATALQIAVTITQRNILLNSQHKISLTYKAGIHTGMITVRRNSNGKEHLTGIALSTAGKLCSIAPENSILISHDVSKIIQSGFDCMPFHNSNYHGNACLLVGEKQTESIINIQSSGCEFFVGRESECATVQEYWDNAITHNGTGVLICGEAGIGKSRLVGEILKSNPSRSWIELRCTEESLNCVLSPVTDYFCKSIKVSGISDSGGFEVALSEILECSCVNKDMLISLLMHWMGYSSKKYTPLQIAPIKQKKMLIDLLVRFFADYAVSQNAVIIIEDVHWVDTATYEFIGELLKCSSNEHFFVFL